MIYLICRAISAVIDFYVVLIIVYCLMTWFPIKPGTLPGQVFDVLSRLVEPYLSIFRRIIPSMGGIDFSPILAILVLELISRLVL